MSTIITAQNDQPQTPSTTDRQPWSRPTMLRRSASHAELHAAVTPDGLGDQLS